VAVLEDGDGWERYGRAITSAMADVLEELPEEARPHALETADYWLSVGLVIGLEWPAEASRLLDLIETDENERTALSGDVAGFVGEAALVTRRRGLVRSSTDRRDSPTTSRSSRLGIPIASRGGPASGSSGAHLGALGLWRLLWGK
jgi:hypothetical protein